MAPLLVDENLNQRILRGLKRRFPALDYVLVQETEVFQQDDPQVLDWAARHGRVIVTHDVNTMIRHAYARLEAGQPLPGLLIIPKDLAIGRAIEELAIVLACSRPEEFPNRVIHLPL